MSQQTDTDGRGNEDIHATILIIDEEESSRIQLSEILEEDGYKLHSVRNGDEALVYLEQNWPDLILLNLLTAEMDGHEVCRRIKAEEEIGEIPLIFIGSPDDEESEVRGFNLGAVDFIPKPLTRNRLKARVKNHIFLKHEREELEERNIQLASAVMEIKQELGLQEHLASRLNKDGFIEDFEEGVYSRHIFMNVAENYLRLAERFQCRLFLFYVGIDNLDWIHETYGPNGYQHAIQNTVKILRDTFRQSDIFILGLFGEGELVSLLLSAPETQENHPALERLQNAIAVHNKNRKGEYDLSISTGTVPYGFDEPFSLEELIEKGKNAMLQNRVKKDFGE